MADVTSLDRLWTDFRALVRGEVRAILGFPGTYEYTITRADSATIDAEPTSTEWGVPNIANLPVRASSIGSLLPTVGKLCHVVFIGGDKRSPRVTWCQPDGGSPVGRTGDPVSVTIPAGTVITAVPGGTLNPTPITLNGAIGQGSTKVSSE